MEGITDTKPEIKKIDFKRKGYLTVYFIDGRILFMPLKFFPSIKKMPVVKLTRYQIADGNTIIFTYADEVYHVQDLLGVYDNYKYNFTG